MDKFTSRAQVAETAEFHAWLDAQEVADIRAMEAEELTLTPNELLAMVARLNDRPMLDRSAR